MILPLGRGTRRHRRDHWQRRVGEEVLLAPEATPVATAQQSPWRRAAQRTADEGGAGLLALGLGVCAAMLITGGVSVTATQLARSDVLDAAAHASASAADRISEAAIYTEGAEAVRLDPSRTRSEAQRVLATTPLPRHVSSWAITSVEVDGEKVRVGVRAVVKPPLVGTALAALGSPVVVEVASTADAHLASAN